MENELENRALLDASAYVLIEETGDSDSQLLESHHSDAADEDDAQSCSRSVQSSLGIERKEDDLVGSGGDLRRADFDEGCGLGKDEDGGGGCDFEDGGGGGSDLEDGVVDQCRRGKNESPAAKRSNGCEGSGLKMVSEREGDRLFWEACLASP